MPRPVSLGLALALTVLAGAPAARAQEPQAPAPQEDPQTPPQAPQTPLPEPEPQAPQPEPPAPQPEPQAPPQETLVPPEPAPPPSTCCRFSARFDPFQLIFRRVAFEGEIKITGPFSIGVEPAFIFGGSSDNLDEKGFALLGFFGWTFSGRPLRGFWLRAVAGFDAFEATLKHSRDESAQAKKSISTGIFGLMIGDSVVFGQNGGFTLSGGIGVGVATANETSLTVHSKVPDLAVERVKYYDDLSRVKLLGSTGIGVTF